MKHAYDLTPTDLLRLVDELQHVAFDDFDSWNPDKDQSDLGRDVARILDNFGLTPAEKVPITKSYVVKHLAAQHGMVVVDVASPPGAAYVLPTDSVG